MTGRIALHGGGEFLAGDEPALRAILEAVSPARPAQVTRAVVVPTAAARGRPDLAAANGVAALHRVAAEMGRGIVAEAVLVVDHASAGDPDLAARLGAADLVVLPGGDPDLIPSLFPGTRAWAAITGAVAGGAVLAGASAGAMALAEVTWTPSGVVQGLGVVRGLIVMPHADADAWSRNVRRFAGSVSEQLGVLGLAERTAIVGPATGPWQVAGAGEVRWLHPGTRDPDAAVVVRHGNVLAR